MNIISKTLVFFLVFFLMVGGVISTNHLEAKNANSFIFSSALSSISESTTSEFTTQVFTKKHLIDSLEEEDILAPAVIYDILHSIPSHLEYAALVKDLGTGYYKEQLSSTESVDYYTTNYKRALNLGIYATDLGYATIYGQDQDAFNYLETIKKLSTNLNIQQFDYLTIKNFIERKDTEVNSVLEHTTLSFEKVNDELQEQKRSYLSALILVGGWIEANYITSLVYQQSHNEELKSRIGEQKLVINRLLLVLTVYQNKPNFAPLIEQLEKLRQIYQNVEIVEKDGMPLMEVSNGEIIITDRKETVVSISEEDTESIIKLLISIRNEIISK